MDTLFIAIAFFCGLLARQLGLPTLVGFLAAGFVLNAAGQEGGAILGEVADLGVTLMLFSIGLKLQVKTLFRSEIWGGTAIHTVAVTTVLGGILLVLTQWDLPVVGGLDLKAILLLAFALSFSSTVFAVKTLEEGAGMGSRHGRTAMGILIMQDLIAVVFLTASLGEFPSIWALPLVGGMLVARPLMGWLLSRSGHGEMVMMYGLFLALVLGAKGFEAVGLKADLGALYLGVLIGQHPKAKELNKSLLSLTDLFLVGFFLNIGLAGFPSWQGLGMALLFTALLPFKTALFFWLLTRFRLRARTGLMAALHLSTFSEFGLIVLAVGAGKGWIPDEWLVTFAITLSLSFLIAAPLNRRASEIYARWSGYLQRFEHLEPHADDRVVQIERERIAVFGMGRVGTAAYGELENRFPGRVLGLDRDPGKVETHLAQGRNVMVADATDTDFWVKVRTREKFVMVVLAMPKHEANLRVLEILKRRGYDGMVAATAKFDDEVRELHALGVEAAYNLYEEAGTGFANHVVRTLLKDNPSPIET